MDRLSELPDEILCHILSFLPTETSVATSILARRWRFLWAYVPTIDFTESRDFSYNKNLRIIDRILLLHKLPSLKSLSIDVLEDQDDCDDFQTESWIFAAIHRNVEYLHLFVLYQKLLPFRLFTCETLVGLRLVNCGVIPTLDDDVWLPCLKKLDLDYVQFEDDESLPCLLSGSPVLEYLRIEIGEDYDEDQMKSYYVSSPTVKWLCLNGIVGTEGNHRLEINTPALEFLSVHDNLAVPVESEDLTSLITADIYDYEESDSLLKFLDTLCNVKCLTLELHSAYTAINDSLLSLWTPSFNNLTKLELVADSRFLSKFLENANNLEILEFHKVRKRWRRSQVGLNEVTKGWIEPQQVPKCLLSCLRTIKIYVDKADCLKIVKYLLRNAQVLKRMDITYPQCFSSDLLQKISLFKRGSKKCKLAFTETGSGTSGKKISLWD